MTCGCKPKWLSSVSEPVAAETAVSVPCPCCGAGIGCRCIGGTAGWLRNKKPDERVAWVDVCPVRITQEQLQV